MLERPATHAHEFAVSGPDAAFAARRAFSEATGDWLAPSFAAEARLLVSELVSTVVLEHETPGPIDVRLIRLGDRGVRAELDLPRRATRSPRTFRLLAGHRAEILDALADRWGVVHAGPTPYVWFELGGT